MTAPAFSAVSYRVSDAVKATGIGEGFIRKAIRDGDLIAHYIGTKPVVRSVDLDEWIESLPTEPSRGDVA